MRRLALPVLLFALLPLAAAGTPQLGIPTGGSQTCPTGGGQYTVTVHNPGPAADRYDISVAAPWSSDTVTLSTHRLQVDAGETEEVFVWVQAPETASPGEYDVTVRATSSNNGKTVKRSADLTVLSCRDVSLSPVDTQQSVCRGEEASYRLNIRNTGAVEETYRLDTSSGTLSTDRVTLDAGERQSISLSVASNTAASRDVTISASSTTSYASDTATVGFTAEECRQVTVDVAPETASLCRSDTLLLSASLTNTGTLDDTYTVSIGGHAQNVSLPAGGAMTIERRIPASSIDGNIQVSATSTSLPAVSDSAVTSTTVDRCYGLRLDTVSTAPTEGDQTLLEVTLTNNGTRHNNYTLQLDGPEWMDVQPETVSLRADESLPVFVYAAPDFFGNGTYTAALVASGRGVSQTLNMNVTARNGTVSVTLPRTATPTGAATRSTSSIIAVLVTALILLVGGWYLFYRERNHTGEKE
ncbi:MAG: hypothetical protein SVW77_01525 [Candidatus Nanohaloarchaea archaeon]|nr:hypothetical protein [Candidatus Nanohaloarchaea archaeon]